MEFISGGEFSRSSLLMDSVPTKAAWIPWGILSLHKVMV